MLLLMLLLRSLLLRLQQRQPVLSPLLQLLLALLVSRVDSLLAVLSSGCAGQLGAAALPFGASDASTPAGADGPCATFAG